MKVLETRKLWGIQMRKKLLIMTIILITILMSSIAMAYCTECSTFGHSYCTQTYWDTNSSGHIRKCCHGYNVMAERVPHTQGQWYTYQSPTNCQTEKIQAWDCTVCGWTHKSYTGTYGPHNWNTTYTNNANSHCYSSVCSVCGATQSEVAHNWNSWTTTSYANCTESGSQQRSCKNSGCSAVQTQVIDALGHSPESYYRYDDYGHRIECIRCYYQFESGPHDMAGWEVVTNPTCTSAGSQKNECRVCDYVKTETIPKLNHNWSDCFPNKRNNP